MGFSKLIYIQGEDKHVCFYCGLQCMSEITLVPFHSSYASSELQQSMANSIVVAFPTLGEVVRDPSKN